MIDALLVIKYSLRDLWDEVVLLIGLNLLWSLAVALPFLPLWALSNADPPLVLGLGLLLALPLPVVSGGLGFVANQISRGKSVGPRTFATGVQRYWVKSLVVGLINLVLLILLVANVWFYGQILEGGWTTFALSAWVAVAVYWLLAQLFWFPMILELQSEKVGAALRHSLALVIVSPLFTLGVGLATLLLAAVCTLLTLPLVLILASLLSLIANHATRSRLAFVRKKPYTPGLDQN